MNPEVPVNGESDSLSNPTETILTPSSRLGPYLLKSELGAGGMGTVFLAEDTRLGRSVAIKVSRGAFTERFTCEARAISALNHPRICTLYDVGPDYLVMELVEGETLASRLRRGPLPLSEALLYASQMADALAEAHARGIIHRDLKPANVMVTRHGIKVLDFGLARILSEAGITETNVIMGTPAYMSPEQLQGMPSTPATDIFALGLMLREMTSDRPPALDRLLAKLLVKDPSKRTQSASQVADALRKLAQPPAAPARRNRLWIPGAALLLLLSALALWLYQRSERRHWAREQAIPEIARLTPRTPLAALRLLTQAQQALPGDPQLKEIAQSLTRRVSVQSSPPGAAVEIQDYLAPAAPWLSLGTTPLSDVTIPQGFFRWRLSRPGTPQLLLAPFTDNEMSFTLTSPETGTSMVRVPEGSFDSYISFLGWLHNSLPPYDMDKFEVTNRQYQQFVDSGGYRRRELWPAQFRKDGREITWDQAMDLFRDPTGRAGPSTWEGGHFPQGHADDPVSGVSWFEASAYAAFAGKSLPSIGQWFRAAPPDLATYIIEPSNFGGRGPWRVGSSSDVGPFGTYDMLGNVREWCLNAVDHDLRFILGGGWRDQPYTAYTPNALSPFDRSDLNGFRCVRNPAPLPAAAAAPLVRMFRDFSKLKPVPDDLFRAYQAMYAYDRTPLNPRSEGGTVTTPDWTRERISIEAGGGNQRLPVYLFLPKNIRPPFQTVLFFPSARVNTMPSSQTPGDLEFVDYVVKSGRALIYPIYTGTYERQAHEALSLVGQRDLMIRRFQEVSRSVDYLETRPEIDRSRIAYLGVSQGAAYGVIFNVLEPRFKTSVFLDGGFFLDPSLPPADQASFVSRFTTPLLMINGRYDFVFSAESAQEPLFRMIGTPAADKRRVLFDTGHDVRQRRGDLSKEVLAWLDKYLGKVSP